MTYKHWILVVKKEWNGITVDDLEPEGKHFSEPLNLPKLDEAVRYGRICIN